MEIKSRKDFLAMPSGTFFIKCKEYINDGHLCVKYETLGNDFIYSEVVDIENKDTGDFFRNRDYMLYGEDVPISTDETRRDGLLDEGQLFLVLSDDDVKAMHAFIGSFIARS